MQKVTSRDTKADILKAYSELTREYKKLQTENQALKKKPAVAARPAPSAVAAGDDEDAAVQDIEAVIAGLEGLRRGFGESSSDLQSALTAEAESLSGVRAEIAGVLGQLKSVHEVEPDDATLGQLIQSWQDQSESFEAEMAAAREAIDAEMKAARKDWRVEQDEHKRAVRERDAATKQSRAREEEEYGYALQQKRALDEDAYKQQKKALQAGLDDAKAAREHAWAEAEAALAEREKEFADLQAKVDAFPDELERETKAAKAQGINIAKRQARIKSDLLDREHTGVRQVFELRIQSLEGAIAEHSARIKALSNQLSLAQKQAQELAVKAIEGAANETSFQALKEIALEQAKTPNKK